MNRYFFIWFATWFVAAQLALVLLAPIAILLLYPIDLLRMTVSLQPEPLSAYALYLILLVGLYWLLRSPAIVAGQRAAGHVAPHKVGFATTMLTFAIVLPIMLWIPFSATGAKAVELAKLQVGPGYRFHISAVHWRTDRTEATVVAYNENGIKEVRVAW